jgi:hypothetical protein
MTVIFCESINYWIIPLHWPFHFLAVDLPLGYGQGMMLRVNLMITWRIIGTFWRANVPILHDVRSAFG